MRTKRIRIVLAALALCIFTPTLASSQDEVVILTGVQLTRVVPQSFYFEGQVAPTQMRNASAARLGAKRHVIAALVDTSGYSDDVREKYQGFFIIDSRINLGDGVMPAGAYGFGFNGDRFNLLDVGGKVLMSAHASQDRELARPRPLMLVKSPDGLRLYAGRSYITITTASEEVEL